MCDADHEELLECQKVCLRNFVVFLAQAFYSEPPISALSYYAIFIYIRVIKMVVGQKNSTI
jgi:hypothetical protein